MNDFEIEFQRLQKERVKLREEIEQASRAEALRFVARIVVSSAGVATSLWVSGLYTSISWVAVLGVIVLAMLALSLGLFFWRASRSSLGIEGYLRIEWQLLINEMPNIFQILSLLGFLTVLLKQPWVKVLVTLFITSLFVLYLSFKRRNATLDHPGLNRKIESEVIVPLNMTLGLIFGLVVYGLASLITFQIR